MASLASRLEEYRLDMQIARGKQMAELLGVKPQTYSAYIQEPEAMPVISEPGPKKRKRKDRTPDYKTLLHIADVLCVSLDWLTGRAISPKWGPLVDQLRVHLRGRMSEIPIDADTMERPLAVIRWCTDFSPLIARPWFIAGVLGLSVPHYAMFLDKKIGGLNVTVKRLSRFAGLDMQWLETGELMVEAPDLGEYAAVVAKSKSMGISPDMLEGGLEDIQAFHRLLRQK